MRILLALVLALAPITASAGQPSGDPKKQVDDNYKQIKKIAQAASTRAKLTAAVTLVVDKMVDWGSFSRKTMTATLWDPFTPKQKATFVAAYKKLITKRYAKRFKPKSTFTVQFRGPTKFKKSKGQAIVKTTVFSEDKGKRVGVDVNYTFVAVGGRWAVGDIRTDGVSRALSYRPKFKRIFQRKGFDALIKAIERNAKKK